MSRNKAQNRIECPNPKKCVIGHWDALKLDFAAEKGGMAVPAVWRLVYFLATLPIGTKGADSSTPARRPCAPLHKHFTRSAPDKSLGSFMGNTQASAKLSSRTKCRRMALGIDSEASKKYPFTASATASRREIQSSP
jgi:hypothetical protein